MRELVVSIIPYASCLSGIFGAYGQDILISVVRSLLVSWVSLGKVVGALKRLALMLYRRSMATFEAKK
jgi:hypothetical protein